MLQPFRLFTRLSNDGPAPDRTQPGTDRNTTMKTCTPLVMLIALSVTNVQAQRAGEISYLDTFVMPEGIVGQRIRSVIETLNSADPDSIRRFIEEETAGRFQGMPVDAHIDAFLGTAHTWGEVSFHGVRT